jgi:putative transposase
MSKHIHKEHNVNLMLYHLVCPAKYRKEVFTPEVENTLKDICLDIQQRYEIRFVEIGADEDHVHFLLQSVPMMLPTHMVRTIKSITAREIFKRCPEVKKLLWGGAFWTSGYYIQTVGKHGNEDVIKKYVQNQGGQYKNIHRTTLSEQLSLFS